MSSTAYIKTSRHPSIDTRPPAMPRALGYPVTLNWGKSHLTHEFIPIRYPSMSSTAAFHGLHSITLRRRPFQGLSHSNATYPEYAELDIVSCKLFASDILSSVPLSEIIKKSHRIHIDIIPSKPEYYAITTRIFEPKSGQSVTLSISATKNV